MKAYVGTTARIPFPHVASVGPKGLLHIRQNTKISPGSRIFILATVVMLLIVKNSNKSLSPAKSVVDVGVFHHLDPVTYCRSSPGILPSGRHWDFPFSSMKRRWVKNYSTAWLLSSESHIRKPAIVSPRPSHIFPHNKKDRSFSLPSLGPSVL